MDRVLRPILNTVIMMTGLLACQPESNTPQSGGSPVAVQAIDTATATTASNEPAVATITEQVVVPATATETIVPDPTVTATIGAPAGTVVVESPAAGDVPSPTETALPQAATTEATARPHVTSTPVTPAQADPLPMPATAAADPSPTAVPLPTLNPQGHVGLGAYLKDVPYEDFASVLAFEQLVHHRMYYVLWFQAWGESDAPFHADWISSAAQKGFIPVITWEPWKRNFDNPAAPQPEYSLAGIAQGQHDDYIRSWAQGAKALGVPIIIRFAHEQSTQPGAQLWYPWQGDPDNYKAAFRHVVSIFRQEGADNVQFLWSAMWLNEWANQYYPGDDVVDYVGTTILNHGTAPTVDWAQWKSFDELFTVPYQAAQQWGKPIILTELASAEQGGDKATWLHDCFSSLKMEYPLVTGVLMLEVASDREWPDINWSVASSPASLQAFRQVINDTYFK